MKKILLLIVLLMPISSFALGLISNFEWLEPSNKVEVAVNEQYQLKFSCSDNSLPFTSNYADSWVHYEYSGGQQIVDSPTGYSISEKGIITGLIPGSYAIKFTGWILPKSNTDKWLYITVVTEHSETESNNTLDTANDIFTKIRFGLFNTTDVDYFKFTNNCLKYGDNVSFKIHYYGTNENPFGYKWATFCDANMVGNGSLMSQDQECKAIVSSGNTVYLAIYYDQSRSQYFNYGEEFVAELYINGEPVNPCGDSIIWKFSEKSKTLTILGTGSMWDFPNNSISPWNGFSSMIKNIDIEDGVASIGDNAFSNCNGLTDVYCYAEEVPATGSNVFSGSNINTATLHVPAASIDSYKKTSPWSNFGTIVIMEDEVEENIYIDGIYYIFSKVYAEVTFGDNAYSGAVVIPASVTYKGKTYMVTSIGVNAFSNCRSLTSIAIPESITNIGENAFYNCTGLKKVIISDIAGWCGISFSGNEANPLTKANHLFCEESTEIKNLIIPNGVTSIGSYAFRYCTGLTSVTIPNSVTSIGDFAFDGCSGLTSINIPNSVTRIGDAALWGCSSLTSIPIPNSVTEIGHKAFEKCSGLISITIPSSVISIGEHAFRYCSALKKVIVPDITAWCDISFGNYQANPLSSAQHLFSDESTEIKDLVIPNGVNIKKFVFFGCSALNSVTIPNSVTSIGDSAFWSCNSLSDVYCYAPKVPNTGKNVFNKTPTATLHVPANSYINYKATSPWSDFETIVSLESETILPFYISLLKSAKKELVAVQGGGHINLIRSVIQLSSPYTEPSEGSLAALLDGDINTFWHSIWRSGSVAGGIHYLQADLINPINENVYVSFTRRPVVNDHVTNMSILGTNVPNASKEACEELLTFDCPYISNTETITSSQFDTKGYRYLRFYANATNRNLGFWHISEFQLYGVIPASEVLINFLDGEDKRLQAIIDEQTSLSSYQISEIEYNTLKEAYDAFMVKLAEIVDGIENVSEGNLNPASTSIYDLNGHRISSPQKGLNIIRYSDSTSRKVLVK